MFCTLLAKTLPGGTTWRHHQGPLVLDRVCSRLATRILIYDRPTPDEIMEQRIIISSDFAALYVFPVFATRGLKAYTPSHVLRKEIKGSNANVSVRSPSLGTANSGTVREDPRRNNNVAFVGMLALGIFVGVVVTLGLKQAVNSPDSFIKIMGAVLTATFSGAVVAFMDKYKGPVEPKSFFMYPIGLLVALLWLYFEDVWKQSNWFLSVGGVICIVLITLIAAAVALVPPLRKLLD